MKGLIIYYTNSYNTGRLAKMLSEDTGFEMEQVLVETPYAESLMSRSKEEIETGHLPAIRPLKHDLQDYDVILLGTPTWWVSPSSPILALVKQGELKGKDVYPFITTGFDVKGVEMKLANALEGSKVHKALIAPYSNAFLDLSKEEVASYAKAIVK